MAGLTSSFKSVLDGFREQWEEAVSVLDDLTAPKSALKDNFKRYGYTLGVFNYQDYEAMARRFYDEGIDSSDPAFTVVYLSRHTVGIDFNGELRGIFHARNGDPIAFFRPDYLAMGYNSKRQELEDWIASHRTSIRAA